MIRSSPLAEQVGVNSKTIRYHESIGLLPQPKHRPSGYRTYRPDDLKRRAFIRRARAFGLRLDVIGEVLSLRDRGERPYGCVLDAVRGELDDLDRRIAELQATRDQLAAMRARA